MLLRYVMGDASKFRKEHRLEPGSQQGPTKAEPNLVACSRFVPLFAVLMMIAMEVTIPVPLTSVFCFRTPRDTPRREASGF